MVFYLSLIINAMYVFVALFSATPMDISGNMPLYSFVFVDIESRYYGLKVRLYSIRS